MTAEARHVAEKKKVGCVAVATLLIERGFRKVIGTMVAALVRKLDPRWRCRIALARQRCRLHSFDGRRWLGLEAGRLRDRWLGCAGCREVLTGGDRAPCTEAAARHDH